MNGLGGMFGGMGGGSGGSGAMGGMGGILPMLMQGKSMGLIPMMMGMGNNGNGQPQPGQDQAGQQQPSFLNQGQPAGGLQGTPTLANFLQGRLGR